MRGLQVKVGDLVRSVDSWGPDEYSDKEYYPVGVVYQLRQDRPHRWWIRWISPAHLLEIGEERACMLDEWLEVLSEAR